MSTTGNDCSINGGLLLCPNDNLINFNEGEFIVNFETMIQCPLDSVAQSEWIKASQQGRCECDVDVTKTGTGVTGTETTPPLDCQCYPCPVGSKAGYAYNCTTPFHATCLTFNCDGLCNGDTNLGLGDGTLAPTSAPTQEKDAAHMPSAALSTALLVLAVFRMFR